MLSSKKASNVEVQYSIRLERDTYVDIWNEFTKHMIRLGYAIKMTYLISEYDGISMLKDILSCFSNNGGLKHSINMTSSEAKELLKTLFNENLGYFLAKLSLASASTVNFRSSETVSKIAEHRISKKVNDVLIKISGVNYNSLSLNELNIEDFKAKLASLSNVLVSICDIALGVYGK
ncbi:MAG: hypothetical protein B6U75_03885 [Desulfurococcales archaeon ex4484_217_1]|nr:MAG: hypothetical protein B6U75_03885 [Desulfurococcales archaeon ex4484_217_1]